MREILDIETTVCRRCFAILDVADNFCRVCGALTERGEETAAALPARWASDPTASDRPKAGDNPWFVLAMLLFVLGPLALPMVWRCRGMTTVWKIVLTALTLGFVAAIVVGAWYVFEHALAPLRAMGKLKAI